VFGHSANNADKYIYNWQFNKLTICLYVPTPRDKASSLHVMCLTSSYLPLGQLTFNYFKMHLLNNQLCLYLILCLCKQIYAVYMYAKNWPCTPDLPAMIIVQHCSHSKQISSSRNICNIFLVYRFSDCISSLSNLDSWSGILKFLCCYFKRMLIIN
jgi:hypothetical protein